jgi:hypothetical protein
MQGGLFKLLRQIAHILCEHAAVAFPQAVMDPQPLRYSKYHIFMYSIHIGIGVAYHAVETRSFPYSGHAFRITSMVESHGLLAIVSANDSINSSTMSRSCKAVALMLSVTSDRSTRLSRGIAKRIFIVTCGAS